MADHQPKPIDTATSNPAPTTYKPPAGAPPAADLDRITHTPTLIRSPSPVLLASHPTHELPPIASTSAALTRTGSQRSPTSPTSPPLALGALPGPSGTTMQDRYPGSITRVGRSNTINRGSDARRPHSRESVVAAAESSPYTRTNAGAGITLVDVPLVQSGTVNELERNLNYGVDEADTNSSHGRPARDSGHYSPRNSVRYHGDAGAHHNDGEGNRHTNGRRNSKMTGSSETIHVRLKRKVQPSSSTHRVEPPSNRYQTRKFKSGCNLL